MHSVNGKMLVPAQQHGLNFHRFYFRPGSGSRAGVRGSPEGLWRVAGRSLESGPASVGRAVRAWPSGLAAFARISSDFLPVMLRMASRTERLDRAVIRGHTSLLQYCAARQRSNRTSAYPVFWVHLHSVTVILMQERCRYAKPMMLKRIDLADGRGERRAWRRPAGKCSPRPPLDDVTALPLAGWVPSVIMARSGLAFFGHSPGLRGTALASIGLVHKLS
jgi:hypothetical protein